MAVYFINQHLVLIASYSSNMCEYMERKGIFENLAEHFEDIRPENLPIFLKIFVNFLKLYPPSVDKIIQLHLINKIAQKILQEESLNILALFFMVLNEFSKLNISPRSYLDNENKDLILNKFLELFEKNDELRVFSYKQRTNPSNFKPLSPTDEFLINELYKKTYQ